MKKTIMIGVSIILVIIIGGIIMFGNNKANKEQKVPNSNGKSIVVFFSMPETTDSKNMSREEELSTIVVDGKVLGNTEYVAYIIGKETKSDIFRIEPVEPYPMNHTKLEEIAVEEQRKEALPEIKGKIENIADYETIFIGYPNWYYDMPRIIYSFLNDYDLSGKTIVPFVTSGASGFSNSINEIKKIEPNANVIENGLSIIRTNIENAKEPTIKWLKEIGY